MKPEPTLDSYIRVYVAGRQRRAEIGPNTAEQLRWRLRFLAEAHGRRPVDHLGTATLDRWLEITAAHRPASRRAYWSTTALFVKWMVATGLLRRSPFEDRPPPKEPRSVPRALHADKVGMVLAVAPNARARVITWFEVGMGMRAIEVAQVRIEDWDQANDMLYVRGKGSNERTLPVIADVRRALEEYLAERPVRYGPIIRCLNSEAGISRQYVSQMMSRWMRLAGVKRAAYDGVGGHSLRHTCGTDMLRKSRDILAVRDALGHSNIAVTSRYIGAADANELRSAMEGREYRSAA